MLIFLSYARQRTRAYTLHNARMKSTKRLKLSKSRGETWAGRRGKEMLAHLLHDGTCQQEFTGPLRVSQFKSISTTDPSSSSLLILGAP